MIGQNQEEMNAGQLFANHQIQTIAFKISPRIAALYQNISDIYMRYINEPEQPAKCLNTIYDCFNSIKYQDYPSDGPICHTDQQSLKYYACQQCRRSSSCYCQNCFDEQFHFGHNYKVLEIRCFCDCGNPEALNSASFCEKHKKQPNAVIANKQGQLFKKEVQFLLFLGFKMKEQINFAGITKQLKEGMCLLVLTSLNKICHKSYIYQCLTSQVLLAPFAKQYQILEKTAIITKFFVNWELNSFYKTLSTLLNTLYPVQKFRKRAIIEYFNRMTSTEYVAQMSVDNNFDLFKSQYLSQCDTILKLIQSNKITPLTLNCEFQDEADCKARYAELFTAYLTMQSHINFPQIIEATIKRVNICSFFNFRNNDSTLNLIYVGFMLSCAKALAKIASSRQCLIKVIRECYAFIKSKNCLNSCAQRTLSISLFQYLQCNLNNLCILSIEEIQQLFQQPSFESLVQCAEKLLSNYFNFLKIENINEYREHITSTKYTLNSKNRIVLSIDFTYLRIAIICLQKISAVSPNLKPFDQFISNHIYYQQRWRRINSLNIKKMEKVQPHLQQQVRELYQTNIFVRADQQIGSNMVQALGAINYLLYAGQTQLPQLILGNELLHPQQDKIIDVFRQCLIMDKNKPKIQMKKSFDRLINNEAIIKKFFMDEFESCSRGQIQLKSTINASYCSIFFDSSINEQTTQRFKSKLRAERTPSILTPFIFTTKRIQKILKLFSQFIEFFLGTQLILTEQDTLIVICNLVIESMIVLYSETKDHRIKDEIYRINSIPNLCILYTPYIKYCLDLFFSYFQNIKNEDSIRQPSDRRQAIRHKKQTMNKEFREMQQKILKQHQQQKIQSKQNSEYQDCCIICKQSKQNEHLNYLCHIRYHNILSSNILNSNEPFVVIITCGHLIHQSCLAKNIAKQNEFNQNYQCFLCKQVSNFRIPILVSRNQLWLVNKFNEQLLAVLCATIQQNQFLQQFKLEILDPLNIGRLLFKSMVYSIRLFYLYYGKLFITNMLPIVKNLIEILRIFQQKCKNLLNFVIAGDDPLVRQIQAKIKHLILPNSVNEIQTFSSKGMLDQQTFDERMQIGKLYQYLLGHTGIKLNSTKRTNQINFYQLPKDLFALKKLIGKCPNCSHINNKMFICLYCGFKICRECNEDIAKHVTFHMGSAVLIDVSEGSYVYRTLELQVEFPSLYGNYIGEWFVDSLDILKTLETLKAGDYMLSQQKLDKIIDQAISDKIIGLVQEQKQRSVMINVDENCQVQ